MYFITAMTNIIDINTKFDSKEYKEHSTRCFGFYNSKKDAIKSVKCNNCDMWETIYDYIVIEEIEEGIHPYAEVVGWFKYNQETNSFDPIENVSTHFCNYALG